MFAFGAAIVFLRVVVAGAGDPGGRRPFSPRAFFSSSSVRSWRLRCAARGLLPCLPAPINSAGKRMSGFWAGGSWEVGSALGCRDFGIGASLTAGRDRSPDPPSLLLRSPARLSAPTTGTLPAIVPGPMYFSRPMAPANGPGRRDASATAADSAAGAEAAIGASTGSNSGSGSDGAAGSAAFGRSVGGAGLGETMTGILFGRMGSPGRWGATGAAFAAGLALAVPPPCKNCLTFVTSSSVKLASADPLPGTPAFVQMSTSSLLSTFSSFANE